MSNDLPEKKKGLLSGLGNPFKVKEKEPSVPSQDLINPALRPAVESASKTQESIPLPAPITLQPAPQLPAPSPSSSVSTPGKAKHFRDEFEVFLSDKQTISRAQPSGASFAAPSAPRSQKPQVHKSADLSREFEFFSKSDKKGRIQGLPPTQAVIAKPPALTPPSKTPPILPSANQGVLVSLPAPVPPKHEAALVPPPPPKIEKKQVSTEPEKLKTPAPTLQVPTLPAQEKKTAPVLAIPQTPAVVKVPEFPPGGSSALKSQPVTPTPVKSVIPIKVSEAVPAPASLTDKKPSEAQVPAPAVVIPVTPVVRSSAPVSSPAPSSLAPAVATPPGASGKAIIKKVELDPNRRKRPVVVFPPVEGMMEQAKVPEAVSGQGKKRGLLLWLGIAVALMLLVGLGFYIYHITRETTAEVVLSIDDLTLTGIPLIVYHFDGQVSQIKRDYAERRDPMEIRLQGIEADLAAAKADLAGREEKKRILTAEVQKLRNSIPAYIAEGEKKLELLWGEESGNLDKAYADQKETLHKEIEKRAADLGLKYERNKELDALEVAVNAFRLSLYGAAKTVNVDEQRIFSEDILKRWRDFDKDWSRKQLEIKEKAMTIKQSPGPRIEDAEKRIETFKVDLNALNVDLASLQEEVNRRQQDEVEEQQMLRDVEKPFLSDLMRIPANNILREWNADLEGKYLLRNLEKSTDMPPGEYLIFVQARKDDDIYWAIKPFVISQYLKTDIVISRQDFVPIRKLIQ